MADQPDNQQGKNSPSENVEATTPDAAQRSASATPAAATPPPAPPPPPQAPSPTRPALPLHASGKQMEWSVVKGVKTPGGLTIERPMVVGDTTGFLSAAGGPGYKIVDNKFLLKLIQTPQGSGQEVYLLGEHDSGKPLYTTTNAGIDATYEAYDWVDANTHHFQQTIPPPTAPTSSPSLPKPVQSPTTDGVETRQQEAINTPQQPSTPLAEAIPNMSHGDPNADPDIKAIEEEVRRQTNAHPEVKEALQRRDPNYTAIWQRQYAFLHASAWDSYVLSNPEKSKEFASQHEGIKKALSRQESFKQRESQAQPAGQPRQKGAPASSAQTGPGSSSPPSEPIILDSTQKTFQPSHPSQQPNDGFERAGGEAQIRYLEKALTDARASGNKQQIRELEERLYRAQEKVAKQKQLTPRKAKGAPDASPSQPISLPPNRLVTRQGVSFTQSLKPQPPQAILLQPQPESEATPVESMESQPTLQQPKKPPLVPRQPAVQRPVKGKWKRRIGKGFMGAFIPVSLAGALAGPPEQKKQRQYHRYYDPSMVGELKGLRDGASDWLRLLKLYPELAGVGSFEQFAEWQKENRVVSLSSWDDREAYIDYSSYFPEGAFSEEELKAQAYEQQIRKAEEIKQEEQRKKSERQADLLHLQYLNQAPFINRYFLAATVDQDRDYKKIVERIRKDWDEKNPTQKFQGHTFLRTKDGTSIINPRLLDIIPDIQTRSKDEFENRYPRYAKKYKKEKKFVLTNIAEHDPILNEFYKQYNKDKKKDPTAARVELDKKLGKYAVEHHQRIQAYARAYPDSFDPNLQKMVDNANAAVNQLADGISSKIGTAEQIAKRGNETFDESKIETAEEIEKRRKNSFDENYKLLTPTGQQATRGQFKEFIATNLKSARLYTGESEIFKEVLAEHEAELKQQQAARKQQATPSASKLEEAIQKARVAATPPSFQTTPQYQDLQQEGRRWFGRGAASGRPTNLPQRGLRGAGRRIGSIARLPSQGGQVAQKLMLTFGRFLFTTPQGLVIVGVATLVLLLVLMLTNTFGGGGDAAAPGSDVGAIVTIKGPSTVGEGNNIPYTIEVAPSGAPSEISIIDEIPSNAEFANANPPGKMYTGLKPNAPETTNPAEARKVVWSLREIQGGTDFRFQTITLMLKPKEPKSYVVNRVFAEIDE